MKTNKHLVTSGSICAVIMVALISATVKLDSNSEGKFVKNGHTDFGGSFDKKKDGSAVAYTQSAHDQTFPGTCSGCHGGGATLPTVNVTFDPPLEANDMYRRGQTYTISYQASGYPFFGICVEMNNGNTVTSMTAGTLSALTNTRYTANPYNMGFPSNISHSAPVPTASQAVFKWVAPIDSVDVYLFSNIVGVNGNDKNDGDRETFYNKMLPAAAGGFIAGVKSEEKHKPTFELYPNPARETVKVKSESGVGGQAVLVLMDLQGRAIQTIAEHINAGATSWTLNTASLSAGTYLVKLTVNGKSSIQKLQVN